MMLMIMIDDDDESWWVMMDGDVWWWWMMMIYYDDARWWCDIDDDDDDIWRWSMVMDDLGFLRLSHELLLVIWEFTLFIFKIYCSNIDFNIYTVLLLLCCCIKRAYVYLDVKSSSQTKWQIGSSMTCYVVNTIIYLSIYSQTISAPSPSTVNVNKSLEHPAWGNSPPPSLSMFYPKRIVFYYLKERGGFCHCQLDWIMPPLPT